jgi:hypothetical protein
MLLTPNSNVIGSGNLKKAKGYQSAKNGSNALIKTYEAF